MVTSLSDYQYIYRPQGEGNVFTGICLFTISLLVTRSLLGLVLTAFGRPSPQSIVSVEILLCLACWLFGAYTKTMVILGAARRRDQCCVMISKRRFKGMCAF